ncbi:MAG: hypothetical protein PGN20_01665 [Agrobacterium cavarae]
MTAVNIHVAAWHIDVFTDSAIFDLAKGGIVEGFGSKVIPLPHQGAVMAATGYSWVSIVMAGVIATTGIETFDQLSERLPALISNAVKNDPGGSSAYGKFELAIAGFSEARQAPEAYVLYSYADQGWPAWHLRKVGNYTSPKVSRRFDPSDPVGSGLRIIEDQRSELCGARGFDGIACHAVGGVAQHTRLDRDGITIKGIRRWPDVVGEKIEAGAA